MNPTEWIWHNGSYKPWHEATTHVLTHGLHYGSSIFEGIRVYEKDGAPVGFRLREHMQRLYDSARVYRIEIPYTLDELIAACHGVVLRNGLKSAYLRPIAFRGYGSIGVAPAGDVPIDVAIAAIEWGAYLGEEARENGARVCVSSWQRVAPNTIPAGLRPAAIICPASSSVSKPIASATMKVWVWPLMARSVRVRVKTSLWCARACC